MAFSETERVQIRRWVGGDFFYTFYDKQLESAINTAESIGAGETEAYIRDVLLVELEALYQQLITLRPKLLILDADEIKIDPMRALMGVRSEGRRVSTQLANVLGFDQPLRDAWSGAEPAPSTPTHKKAAGAN